MAVNFDPAKGMEVAEQLTRLCNGEMLEVAQVMYDAIKSLGDDNNITTQFGERLGNFQNVYNAQCVDAFNSLKAGAEQFTDIATYVSKVQLNTSVQAGETQRADEEATQMDAMAGW